MAYRYRSPLEGSYHDQESVGYRNEPRASPYGSRSHHDRRSSHGESSRSDGSRSSHGGEHTSAARYRRYDPQAQSESLPRELRDLFGALECRLCDVEVPSPIVAKMHYSGKQHMKKVKTFLIDHGYPVPDLGDSLPSAGSLTSTMADYCEVCNVRLISVNDKLLHYSGKNHQKNARDPANAKKKKKIYDDIDLSSGRFGIGLNFQLESLENETNMDPELVSMEDLVCKLCDVKAVSIDQLKMHLNGKKHKEKLVKKESNVPKSDKPYECKICQVSLDTLKLWKMHLSGKRHAKSLKKLELEGNGDRCEQCDITFTSPEHYLSHMQGKKHEKLSQRTSRPALEVSDGKISLACKFCPFVGNIDEHQCDQSLMTIEHEDLESKFICFSCHNMVFNSEEELAEHQNSRRHLLCVLNQEEGDVMVEELAHWYCYPCKKQLLNHKEYTDHHFESKHITLTTNLDSTTDLFKCTVCDLVMDKQAKEEHMTNKNHLKLALKTDTLTTIAKLANENITTTNFYCGTCNVTLNSLLKYSEHILQLDHVERTIAAKLQKMKKSC